MRKPVSLPFVDLHAACAAQPAGSLEERLQGLMRTLPPCALAAVGGFPFTQGTDNTFSWLGSPATQERIQEALRAGLGTSAVLTYTNPKNRSLDDLGHLCVDMKHLWGFHWMTVSILFSGAPMEAELAFARDGRFQMSWPVVKNATMAPRIFVAHGTLKTWLKFCRKEGDLSFDEPTRKAMTAAGDIIDAILP